MLLDNAPSHPSEEELKSDDGLITTMFMPPNVTPLIQPMDQNAIRITKLFYRRNLLTQLLAKGTNISASLQNYTLRDAIANFIMAWNSLEQAVIQKCWHNILLVNEDDDENIPLSELRITLLNDEAYNVSKTVTNLLQHIEPSVVCQETDIEQWNNDIEVDNIEQEEHEIDLEAEKEDDCVLLSTTEDKIISTVEAINSLNTVIQWVEENETDIEYSSLLTLFDLRQKMMNIRLKKKQRQLKITSFFISENQQHQ